MIQCLRGLLPMISLSFFQFSKIFLLFYISICILELALLVPKQKQNNSNDKQTL